MKADDTLCRKAIHILTNLTQREASAIRVAEIYRKRWRIEGLFQELTQALRCEIDTLAYPRAALLAFCLAVKAYNAVSLAREGAECPHCHATQIAKTVTMKP